jgi:UDP-N-acetylglucosamine--N-acetylmuramyl-(pentapeptide) pyrophosphoryl-undecaprenol N-acetylglucosamine transferase
MKLLITGGGTGGHVSPGLAVAKVWMQGHGKDSVVWAGRQGGIEQSMAKAAGLSFYPVASLGLRRSLDWRNLLIPYALVKGLAQAWSLLKKERPGAALMTGGYAGVPVALACALKNTPLVLLEPNAYLGLANRFFLGAAEAVCLAYPMPKAPRHSVVTGNPVRFSPRLMAPARARDKFKLKAKEPVLLVLAGSQAAHSVNEALAGALMGPKALTGLQLIWVTGSKDQALAAKAVKAAGVRAFVAPFIDDVASAYAASDLLLARAGASLLAEIAIAAKPSLLVPFPYATADHQRLNARRFVEAGAARMVLDKALSPERLKSELKELFSSPRELKRMGLAARKLAKPDAAQAVAGVMDRVMKGFSYV